MSRHYFGTDGVRGEYGGPVINVAFARRLGAAVGRWMKDGGLKISVGGLPRVLIGRDTRDSGPALEAAFAAGLAGQGLQPLSLGIVPTPAVSRAVDCRS
jgi:phosphoglucosamine mutase